MEVHKRKKYIPCKYSQKRKEVTTLISGKIDFKLKNSPKRQRKTAYNIKKSNPSGRYNNYKHTCTKI